jgi:murein DD-endopeptidase MepM/ murein hydrolase activator NlpD
MGYVAPCDDPIVSDWADHKYRDPPSAEPGTDYACPYGTSLAIADNGTITVADHSNSGPEGRRCTIVLDDGREVSYIHLSRINAHVGLRVSRGEQHVIISGASGNGNDWYYGAHVHVTLHEMPNMSYANSIDFELYVGNDPEPEPPEEENEDMAKLKGASYVNSDGQTVFLLFNEESGYWVEHTSGNPGEYNNPIAQNWETNSWAPITESHAKSIKNRLDNVGTDVSATTARWAGVGAIVVLIIVVTLTALI